MGRKLQITTPFLAYLNCMRMADGNVAPEDCVIDSIMAYENHLE